MRKIIISMIIVFICISSISFCTADDENNKIIDNILINMNYSGFEKDDSRKAWYHFADKDNNKVEVDVFSKPFLNMDINYALKENYYRLEFLPNYNPKSNLIGITTFNGYQAIEYDIHDVKWDGDFFNHVYAYFIISDYCAYRVCIYTNYSNETFPENIKDFIKNFEIKDSFTKSYETNFKDNSETNEKFVDNIFYSANITGFQSQISNNLYSQLDFYNLKRKNIT